MELPSSMACLRNREPIAQVLKTYIKDHQHILEIGHGTGEHALYFAQELPVFWHPADQPEHNWMANERLKQFPTENLNPAIPIKVGEVKLKDQVNRLFDLVFTANTLHIMREELAYKFCDEVGELIEDHGYLLIYGPFKFEGIYTSESNEVFDQHLKARDPLSGIREFEKLNEILISHGLKFVKRHDMPANNQLLVFQK